MSDIDTKSHRIDPLILTRMSRSSDMLLACTRQIALTKRMTLSAVSELIVARQRSEQRILNAGLARPGERSFDRLSDLLKGMESAARVRDVLTFAHADVEFHLEVGRSCRVPALGAPLEHVREAFHYQVKTLVGVPSVMSSALRLHQGLLAALYDSDQSTAVTLWREHLRRVGANWQNILKSLVASDIDSNDIVALECTFRIRKTLEHAALDHCQRMGIFCDELELERLVETAQRRAKAGSTTVLANLSIEFHRRIISLAQNSILNQSYDHILPVLRTQTQMLVALEGSLEIVIMMMRGVHNATSFSKWNDAKATLEDYAAVQCANWRNMTIATDLERIKN